jgi:F-type H+-transporting ATPase subunit alpha
MFSPLGTPCDSGEAISSPYHAPVLHMSAPLHARRPISAPLHTGTRVIDTLCPMSRGQRMLVLGDRMTGKSSVAMDAVASQVGGDVLCVYCCLGKSVAGLEKTVAHLKGVGAMEHTCVVVATDHMSVAEQYLAPYTALTVAEYFSKEGRDVLVVMDDLTKHAWAYRQVALLLERSPGREAYPGDIFYVQTQLFERAGAFADSHGGGSISLIALAETQQEDMTAYIPSNLISMCDGYVSLSSGLAGEGVRPPVDVRLSTSTVGGRVQPKAVRQLGDTLRSDYMRYLELMGLSQLSAGVSAEGAVLLNRGQRIRLLFQQKHHEPTRLSELVFLLGAMDFGLFEELASRRVAHFCSKGYALAVEAFPEIAQLGADSDALNVSELALLEKACHYALTALFPTEPESEEQGDAQEAESEE